ncbi:MAG: glycoside hydrolase family 15 protein [Pseudomonadales bacterium]
MLNVTVALVGSDGSIDWCCFPELDRASVFAALLDHRKGGRFRVTMSGAGPGEQHYLDDSNVLRTTFSHDGARLQITDFMPLSGRIDGCCDTSSEAPPEIVRVLECLEGQANVELEWAPRLDYGRAPTAIVAHQGGWCASGGDDSLFLAGADGAVVEQREHGPVLLARWRMSAGEQRAVVSRWQEAADADVGAARRALQQTAGVWQAWARQDGVIASETWGPWRSLVVRSSLLCKLLTHAESGAIVAAPTTSLPEWIGGVRNWDYRFAWIRDASQTAQALMSLGHTAEAIDLLRWMERVSEAHCDDWELQIMYGVRGQEELPERELSHLEGYRGSSPVRIGNGAAGQFQLEVYGELLNTGYELARRGEDMKPRVKHFLRRVADHVVDVWQQPDYGIWEVRGEARHFTYSKVMAWVALDRAVLLAGEYGLEGDVAVWSDTAETIRRDILDHGYDPQRRAFVQSYGSQELDAANLRIPLMEFLPADDPRVQHTIDRTLEELTENDLVYRYRGDDGLEGEEGAFGLCTFWLVDALALSGRVDEAERIFTNLLAHANPVGLFPEQFHPESGEFLGNYPQAFTHIGLINSVLYLAWARQRSPSALALIGTPEHRAGQVSVGDEP